jgi:GNAT superfamily N-acetyltransferase
MSQPRFAILPSLLLDIQATFGTYFDAFEAYPHGRVLLSLLFPDSDTSTPSFREAHADGTLEFWRSPTSATQYTFKCVDLSSGAIVGMAICEVFLWERTMEERKNPGVEWIEPGPARERAERVLGRLWEAREKQWGGQKYICKFIATVDLSSFERHKLTLPVDVHAFAVNPRHQGRGAGAALVQHVVDLGVRTNLPVYLESSPSSKGLYQKLGFQTLDEGVTHAAEDLGSAEDVHIPLMVMYPDGGSSGSSAGVVVPSQGEDVNTDMQPCGDELDSPVYIS